METRAAETCPVIARCSWLEKCAGVEERSPNSRMFVISCLAPSILAHLLALNVPVNV